MYANVPLCDPVHNYHVRANVFRVRCKRNANTCCVMYAAYVKCVYWEHFMKEVQVFSCHEGKGILICCLCSTCKVYMT